jgi:hypothetical protein
MKCSFFLLILLVLSITSCQKELSDPLPENPNVTDSSNNFRVTKWNEYYYEDNGRTQIINDSAEYIYKYDDDVYKTTILGKDWYQGFLNNDYKIERYFDAKNNWLKEYVYEDSVTIALTGSFFRDITGLPQKYTYGRYRYNSPGVETFTSVISYKSLPGGGKEIIVVDTMYEVYPSLAYYKVFLDVGGKPTRINYLPWNKNTSPNSIYFYYNNKNQIVKEIDSIFYLGQVTEVNISSYIYDTLSNNIGKNLTLSLKGKDFWWFSQDKFYYLEHWDYIDKHSGSFITERTVNKKQFSGGAITSDLSKNEKTVTVDDKIKKCITSTIYENNIRSVVVKYYYEKIK